MVLSLSLWTSGCDCSYRVNVASLRDAAIDTAADASGDGGSSSVWHQVQEIRRGPLRLVTVGEDISGRGYVFAMHPSGRSYFFQREGEASFQEYPLGQSETNDGPNTFAPSCARRADTPQAWVFSNQRVFLFEPNAMAFTSSNLPSTFGTDSEAAIFSSVGVFVIANDHSTHRAEAPANLSARGPLAPFVFTNLQTNLRAIHSCEDEVWGIDDASHVVRWNGAAFAVIPGEHSMQPYALSCAWTSLVASGTSATPGSGLVHVFRPEGSFARLANSDASGDVLVSSQRTGVLTVVEAGNAARLVMQDPDTGVVHQTQSWDALGVQSANRNGSALRMAGAVIYLETNEGIYEHHLVGNAWTRVALDAPPTSEFWLSHVSSTGIAFSSFNSRVAELHRDGRWFDESLAPSFVNDIAPASIRGTQATELALAIDGTGAFLAQRAGQAALPTWTRWMDLGLSDINERRHVAVAAGSGLPSRLATRFIVAVDGTDTTPVRVEYQDLETGSAGQAAALTRFGSFLGDTTGGSVRELHVLDTGVVLAVVRFSSHQNDAYIYAGGPLPTHDLRLVLTHHAPSGVNATGENVHFVETSGAIYILFNAAPESSILYSSMDRGSTWSEVRSVNRTTTNDGWTVAADFLWCDGRRWQLADGSIQNPAALDAPEYPVGIILSMATLGNRLYAATRYDGIWYRQLP